MIKSISPLILIFLSSAAAIAGEYFMTVATKTGSKANSGTDGLEVAIVLNKDPNYRYVLDNKGLNDFEASSLDEFKMIPIDIDPEDVQRAALTVSRGEDAWFCEELYLTFYSAEKATAPIRLRVNRWMSGNKEEGSVSKTLVLQNKIKFD